MKIYLAGGLSSGWQDWVKLGAPQHDYYDPRQDTDQRYNFEITLSDLGGVDWADLVFANFERDKTTGTGLAVEVGYGVAKGKRVIIVDSHDKIHVFMASCCERLYTNLEAAISYLRELEE